MRFAYKVLVLLACLFSAALIYAADNRKEELLEICDYGNFYFASKMVHQGKTRGLYPDIKATSMDNSQLSAFISETLSSYHGPYLGVFSYPPVLAALLIPICQSDIRTSLVVFQSICFGLYLISVYLFCRTNHLTKSFWPLAASSLILLTVAQVLLIGQMVIFLGLLPLTLGYCLFIRKRFFWAGAAWSILFCKPSFLVAIALFLSAIIYTSIKEKRWHWQTPVGLASGILLIISVSSLIYGFDFLPRWLHSIQLFAKEIRINDMVPANVMCFTGATLCFLPAALENQLRIFFSIFSIAAASLLFYYLTLLMKSAKAESEKTDLVFIISLLALPIVLPYFRVYDFTLLLPIGWIAYYRLKPSTLRTFILAAGSILVSILNVYFLASNMWTSSVYVYSVQCLVTIIIAVTIASICALALKQKQ